MAEHHIARDHVVYGMDKSNPPVTAVDPGDVVVFETYDARTGTIQSEADLLDRPHPLGSNPATGPVFVRGAGPGDTLCIEVEGIDLADRGYLAVKAGQGLLGHLADRHVTRVAEIEDGTVLFGKRIRFQARPMIGVIGTAPAGEGVGNSFPGPHGGNMDNKYVTTGSRIYLPVYVAGALLALGDVHGSQGDGELSYVGLEICAQVKVKVSLIKEKAIARPLIETPEFWVTTGEHKEMAQATRMAAEEMALLLQRRLDFSFEEAYMLMSAAVDVQICQCCDPGIFPVTTRAVISKEILP